MAGKYFIRNSSSLFFSNRALTNNLKLSNRVNPIIAFQTKNVSSSLDTTTNRLVIKLKGNVTEEFPFVWLRDNCQCASCYDASSKSRTISFADFQLDSKPKSAVLDGNTIHLTWVDGHRSSFDLKWLEKHSFLPTKQKSWLNSDYQTPYSTWNADVIREKMATFNFQDIMNNDEALLKWLQYLEIFGVCLIDQVPDSLNQVGFLANRVGFIKRTHYGEQFSVQAKANAANVAYTSEYLQLHTDLPYYEYKPGINLLHCYIQYQGKGGDSLLADGFYIAEWLRNHDPEAYKILAETEVSWLDIGQENGNHFHKIHNGPVICESSTMRPIRRINFSQPQRDSHLAVAIDKVEAWYRALKTFYSLALHPSNLYQFKLEPRQLLAFDNLRCLHGRTGFGIDMKGERHVQGAYLDWDEARSKIRVLKTKMTEVELK